MSEIITVVVPIYNAERFLRKCVDSILRQTYTFLDIILVNDGSCDSSGSICNEYAKKDARIRVIHKKNEGVSSARNDGIRYAKGKYIVFIDSDDYIEEDYCQKLYELQVEYEDSFIICGFNTIELEGNRNRKNLYDSEEKISILSKKNIVDIMSKWLLNMPWNKLYNVNMLRQKKVLMIENLSSAEDVLFNLEYIDKVVKAQIVIINEGLYNYTVRKSDSLDNKYCPNKLEIIKMVNACLFDLCKKIEIEDMQDYYTLALQHLESVMRNNMKEDNPKTYLEKIAENNRIMKSQEYQLYLRKSGKRFSLFRKLVCRCGNFILYEIAIKCYELIEKIKRELYADRFN